MIARPSVWARIGRHRLLVMLVAFVAYAPGFWWGIPHATAADRTNAWGVDDEPPLGPLAQAHDILHPKAEQNPNLGYPMMHPFMVLGAFAPYMGWLFATGGVSSPTVEYPHGFADPVRVLATLTLIAHFLSVVLAVGVVLCAYEIGRILWDQRSGLYAAAGVLLIYPMFYYARNSNVDVPVLFFSAAALVAFAYIVRDGLTMRRALAFGALAGTAVATKEPAFASFAFAPVVLPFMRQPGDAAPWRTARFWRMAIAGAVIALVAYAIGSGMLVDYRRWIAHLEFARSRLALLESGEIAFVKYYPHTLAGNIELAGVLLSLVGDAMSWPGFVLGVAGVVAVTRRNPRDGILALSAIGYLLILFVSARAAHLRYVMPPAFILAIYAGRGVAMAAASANRAWRTGGLALGGVTALLLAAWALDLTYAMLRDSRYTAGAWLAGRARAGDALEYFGSEHKNPPMPPYVQSRQAIPFRGSAFRADTSEVAVRAIVDGWNARRPRFIALIPDYTNPGKPHASSCPPAIFRALEDGSLQYRRAALIHSRELLPFARRPELDYPVVNPPIRLYERVDAEGNS